MHEGHAVDGRRDRERSSLRRASAKIVRNSQTYATWAGRLVDFSGHPHLSHFVQGPRARNCESSQKCWASGRVHHFLHIRQFRADGKCIPSPLNHIFTIFTISSLYLHYIFTISSPYLHHIFTISSLSTTKGKRSAHFALCARNGPIRPPISCTHRKEVRVTKSRWQFRAQCTKLSDVLNCAYQTRTFSPFRARLAIPCKPARNGMSRKIYQTSDLRA